ncbi:hypothetical protein H4582DRAFT_2052940 [Lactarius indigo]|nr:hypothetical protein H4582DRAFT_2052940 [Lactarius indigo]
MVRLITLEQHGAAMARKNFMTAAKQKKGAVQRRVGRGEEVDDNGNAAPVCETERDRDVEVGAGQVRQEDTPARYETISRQAAKRKGGKIESQIGVGQSPIAHMGVREWVATHDRRPKGEARRFSGDGSRAPSGRHQVKQLWGASVCDKNKQRSAQLCSLTKRELRNGSSRWGNLDIERERRSEPLFGVKIEAEKDCEQVFVKYTATKVFRGGQKIEENMKWNAERARWRHNVDSLKNRKGECGKGHDGSWTEARKYDMLEGPRLLELVIQDEEFVIYRVLWRVDIYGNGVLIGTDGVRSERGMEGDEAMGRKGKGRGDGKG